MRPHAHERAHARAHPYERALRIRARANVHNHAHSHVRSCRPRAPRPLPIYGTMQGEAGPMQNRFRTDGRPSSGAVHLKHKVRKTES